MAGSEGDEIFGESGADNLNGGGGDDLLDGGSGDDMLDGGSDYTEFAGNDTLLGGDGHDDLWGNAGNDALNGGVGNDQVSGGDGSDLVEGDEGNDFLFGGNGSDLLRGGAGDDEIDSGKGDDRLFGGAGVDILEGGDGYDQASYEDAGSAFTLGLTDVALSTGEAAGDVLSNIEWVHLGAYSDRFVGDDSGIVITGGAGADTLEAGTGQDTASYVTSGTSVTVSLIAGEIGRGGDAEGDTLTGIENLTGSAYADTLAGDGGANVIDGSAGSDTLVGSSGDDVYIIDSIGDDIYESTDEGSDSVRTALASYTLGVNLERLAFIGVGTFTGSGNNLNNLIAGGAGDDYLYGGYGSDTLNGAMANDTLDGGSEDDSLDGGAGDDWLLGGAGADTYVGGEGFDAIDYTGAQAAVILDRLGVSNSWGDAAGDVVTSVERFQLSRFDDRFVGASEGDFIYGGDGHDTLLGGAGDDVLVGQAGFNQIYGEDGNDWIVAGSGADSIDGGAGSDTVSFVSSTASITVDLTVPAMNTSDAAGDTFSGVETFLLTGLSDRFVAGTDRVYVDGGEGNDTLIGGAGSDQLLGGAGEDSVTGGEGNDSLVGGTAPDQLFGGTGDDSLTGSKGSDLLDGQDGFDTADYTSASMAVILDRLTASNSRGDAAGDVIVSIERFQLSSFDDGFVGSSDFEFIYGGDGNDSLSTSGGDDWLIGGTGADTLNGGSGYDFASYYSASGPVRIDRTTPSSSFGDATGDTFTEIEAFQLTGAHADQFLGNDEAEAVYGGGGNDTLLGNGGNDFLDGEENNDILTGGAGSDIFVFYERDFGNDSVADFTNGDVLTFSVSAFSSFAGVSTQLTQVGADTVITLNAENSVTLKNVVSTNLSATDFSFV